MCVIHLVEAALPPPDPLRRIRVGAVGGGVVVPGGQMEDRAGGQHGRRIVGVDVVHMPVEVEVGHVAQHPDFTVGKDRFQRHRLAANVHVRLVVLEPRRRSQRNVGVMCGDLSGRNVQCRHRLLYTQRVAVNPIFRHVAARMKPDTQLRMSRDLLAHRVIVVVEGNP